MLRFLPEDWSVMRAGIFAWAKSQSGVTTIWKKQNAPAPERPYVALTMVTPPVQRGQQERRSRGTAILIPEALPDTAYVVTVDGVDCEYVTGDEPTTAEIRDALAELVVELAPPHTTRIVDEDLFTIVTPRGTLAPEIEVSENLALKVVVELLAIAVATFQVDAYATTPDQAMTIAQSVALGLEKPSVRESLSAAGVAPVDVLGWRKPDLVAGSAWEDRAGFDVRFSCVTRAVDVLDFIEDAGTIEGTLSL